MDTPQNGATFSESPRSVDLAVHLQELIRRLQTGASKNRLTWLQLVT